MGYFQEKNKVRLNKWIASQGICSRREADRLIEAGKVTVNGEAVTSLGTKINPYKDKVGYTFDPESFRSAKTTVVLNKPDGFVVTASEEEGANIYSLTAGLPDDCRPVGRLDKDSSGIIILTNDTSLPAKIIGEGTHCEKEYFVKTTLTISDPALDKLRHGVKILDDTTLPARIRRESADSFYITLVEGKNRQIRRMCRKVGASVETLIRVRIGNVRIGNLQSGQWRQLTPEELSYFDGL
ncbi:MAG: hypothetical protein A2Y33_13140 [Spirochaetes bacterium GWF1_51_8]|nr:MAG: hypothetical protein A2Y33_13140 [Spirochaetes bacterium GWF1_51_8]